MNKTTYKRAGAGVVVLAASALLIAVPLANGADPPSRDPEIPVEERVSNGGRLQGDVAPRSPVMAADGTLRCAPRPVVYCPV